MLKIKNALKIESDCLQTEWIPSNEKPMFSLSPELKQYCKNHGIKYEFDMSHFSTKVLGSAFYLIFMKNEKRFSIASDYLKNISLYKMISLLEENLSK